MEFNHLAKSDWNDAGRKKIHVYIYVSIYSVKRSEVGWTPSMFKLCILGLLLRFLKYSCELQTDFNVKENAVFSQSRRAASVTLVNDSPQLSPEPKQSKK